MKRTLAAIDDLAPQRREPACWRAVRIDKPRPVAQMPVADTVPDPSCSVALARWRRLLASRPLSSAYRISRV